MILQTGLTGATCRDVAATSSRRPPPSHLDALLDGVREANPNSRTELGEINSNRDHSVSEYDCAICRGKQAMSKLYR